MDNNVSDLALWRYGLISPLLHEDPQGRTQGELIAEIAAKNFIRPDKGSRSVSGETLRRWLYRFRAGGIAALEDETREGRFDIPQLIRDQLVSLRLEYPRWTLTKIFKQLRTLGLWNGEDPSQAALYRYCKARHLNRDPHLVPVPCRAFEFAAFGQLWVADFLHGPKLWFGKFKRKVYLHAIIDDCTRYVVAGRFHQAEDTRALFIDLKDAVRRFGVPHRFYSDNGSAYKSRHLKVVAARLKISCPHTPPYTPQGRGKIERFFRTVQDSFLLDFKAKTLTDLNTAFDRWLADYHQSIHRGIKTTPLSKRLEVQNVCRELPEVADIDPLFFLERRCRVYLDGTVRIHGHEFEVPDCQPRTRTTVFYLPWDLSRAWYGEDRKLARPLDKIANSRRFDNPKGDQRE